MVSVEVADGVLNSSAALEAIIRRLHFEMPGLEKRSSTTIIIVLLWYRGKWTTKSIDRLPTLEFVARLVVRDLQKLDMCILFVSKLYI